MSNLFRAAALAGGLVLAATAGAFAQTPVYPPQPAASAWPVPQGGVYGPRSTQPLPYGPYTSGRVNTFGRRFPPTPWYLALHEVEPSLAPQQHEQIRLVLEQFHSQFAHNRSPQKRAAEGQMHSQIESMLNPQQMGQFQGALAQFRADRRSHAGPYAHGARYGNPYPNGAYPSNPYPNQYPNSYPNGAYPAPTPIPNRTY